MKVVLAIVLLTVAVSEQLRTDLNEWENFKVEHGKVYKNLKEEQFRQRVFNENKAKIEAHNELFKIRKVSYKMGLNMFSDMTREEFLRTMLPSHFIKNKQRPKPKDVKLFQSTNVQVPDSVDWRDKGYVTEIKDQGGCGSCWAFSATGSLEGQHFKSTGKLVSLSEQNLLDCATDKYGNHGCGGGYPEGAMQYVIDNGGIDTEDSYPYTGMGQICHFDKANVGATATGYVHVKSGDENALKEATATVGPISVSINATGNFYAYSSGIFYDQHCLNSNDSLDHSVLVVGYGTQDTEDYWIVKNSWSTSWGLDGYVLMARNRDNNCGIATDALYPTVD